MADANERIAATYHDHEKRKAAEFLSSQIELLKEERRALLEDNDVLNMRINDLLMENEALRQSNQIVDFLQGTEQMYGNEDEERMKRMYKRIEELEDLLVELKQKSGVNRIIDLEAQISALNVELGDKSRLNEELQERLQSEEKKETCYFDENDSINFFSALIKEKEEKIKSLSKKLGEKNQYLEQREQEKQKITLERDDAKRQNQDLKVNRDRIMGIMKENQNAYRYLVLTYLLDTNKMKEINGLLMKTQSITVTCNDSSCLP